MKLRWKKDKPETGLRSIGARPTGSILHDGERQYATVSALGGGVRPLQGWYWVAGWGSGIPHKNTCNEPCATVEEAKAAAMEYVKKHLNAAPTVQERTIRTHRERDQAADIERKREQEGDL